MDMTPHKAVRERLNTLTRHVTMLVKNYEEETGLRVDKINVDRFHTLKTPVVPQITIMAHSSASWYPGYDEVIAEIEERLRKKD